MAHILPKSPPKEVVGIVSQYAKSLRMLKKVDPKTRYVLICPNWENTYVGMGFNLLNVPSAERVFEEANKLLNRDLFKLCLEGPKSELIDSYENKTLATYVTSHALIKKLASEQEEVMSFIKGSAGIGIGLINSLVFSGSMSFEDGLDLVKRIGQAMDRVVKIVPTAKIVVGLRPATSRYKMCHAAMEHCIKHGIPHEIAICGVSRQLPGDTVEIAGHEAAIEYLEKDGARLLEYRWIRRVQKNPHANHTEIMKPVSDFLNLYIKQKLEENINYIRDPENCSVYSATSGKRLRFVKSIEKDLCDYPMSTLKIQALMTCLLDRGRKLAQPNIFVLWDRAILKQLLICNKKAYSSAKLLRA